MNDIPRQKLQYIISQFGRVICDDPRRCEALLRDLCPENKREINLLVGAAKERVAADLMTASDTVPKEILFARLTRRLYDNLGMAVEFAHWAVESWALALGVISGPMPGQPVQKSGKIKTPPKPENVWTDPVTGMEFIKVPGGTFMMGDIFGDGDDDEKPVHEVRLDEFYIGKYPVTQGQWEKIMGDNPSYFEEEGDDPVESVSWDDAQEFIGKLAEMNKGRYEFRLPTEAQWEYAARSGGKKERYAGGDDIDAVAWYGENSGGSTHPVGQKSPNGLGLYDMSGNVWEWCQDWHGIYPSGSENYKGPSTGSLRVLRGGSWVVTAGLFQATSRNWFWPDSRIKDFGFRLVLLSGHISSPVPGPPVRKSGKTATPPESAVISSDPKSVWTDWQRIESGYSSVSNRLIQGVTYFISRIRKRPKSGKITTQPEPAVIPPEPESAWTDPVTGMEFGYVPGGTFMMGDILGDNEYNKYDDEKPVHEVRLSDFYLGKYPVTQWQWKKVMGNNPSHFQKRVSWWKRVMRDDYPVENVSWNDTQKFIVKLSEMNKGRYEFRLPTEAEWEYAARSSGKDERYAGGDDIDAVAWYHSDGTHPVGQKAPNGLGIHDMTGNVWEWCGDWYGDYPSGSVKNPKGPRTGSSRVERGGSWCSEAGYCRSAYRNWVSPGVRSSNLGFRLALSSGQQ